MGKEAIIARKNACAKIRDLMLIITPITIGNTGGRAPLINGYLYCREYTTLPTTEPAVATPME